MTEQTLSLLAGLQAQSISSVAIILAACALATAFSFAFLGGKFFESVTRQPELMNALQTRLFIIAGLLDAVSMIAVGLSAIFIFANPFISQLLEQAAKAAG
ncbi:MAG: F0F1 ATP synthase subunit C [Pseudomonadota bacterium]